MQSSSYGLLADLVGEFLGDSTYSESSSLSPEQADNVTSPSGSSGILVVVDGPSVVCERIEIILPLPMGDCVSWAVPERSGK